MDARILEDIGLTAGETKIYLALLTLGPSKTGPIAKESGVSASKVYKILNKLEKKGLVGHGLQGKVKVYRAMEPRTILHYVERREQELVEKKNELTQLIPQLEQQRLAAKPETQATLYQGIRSIKNFMNNVIEDLEEGETYHVLGATYADDLPGIRSFFQNYHKRRTEKGINVKMLANIQEKGKMVSNVLKLSEIRFLPQYLVTNMVTVFYKQKTFIYFFADQPQGFLIEDERVAKSFETYFETFWKIATK